MDIKTFGDTVSNYIYFETFSCNKNYFQKAQRWFIHFHCSFIPLMMEKSHQIITGIVKTLKFVKKLST